MKTQIVITNIVGERLHQHESSADVIISPDRHTAAFIASTTRALKKANTASGQQDGGDDDSGDPSANVSSGNATPAATKAYILRLRAKDDDAPDMAINATRLPTNGRIHKSGVGLRWRVCCQAIRPLLFHGLPLLRISTTALELTL